MRISAVIPAYNESLSIAKVIGDIDRNLVRSVIVVDNGSSDNTGEIADSAGALVVREDRRGYGWACLAGIAAAPETDIFVFLDGDYSDFPEAIPELVLPIVQNRADLVIGSRVRGGAEKGSLSLPQRFGNFAASKLLNLIFNTNYTDLGPFRAIRSSSLKELNMKDKKYGWTVEMQIKAAFMGIRALEIPVPYRKRHAGRSKVSGTLSGVIFAGSYILFYLFQAFFQSLFSGRKENLNTGNEGA